jgi:hypothetical protein
MAYLRDCDPMIGKVIWPSKTTAVQYKKSRPGELVHMDVTKLGKSQTVAGQGSGGHESSVPQRQNPGRLRLRPLPRGRLLHACLLRGPTRRARPTCAAFLARAATNFTDHGIAPIERLMTDNA